MIGPRRRRFIIPVVLALVPASAGASAGRPPVALTATPAHVVLAGSARTTVHVTNSGTTRVAVDVSRAGFGLDLRGRPRIAGSESARSAAGWLTLRPTHLTIGPRSTASLVVSAKVPRGAEPGDHDALALLSTRPVANGRVAVRLRLGVLVVVRAPGAIVHRLELRDLQLTRRDHATELELIVANRGNVTESLQGVRAVLSRPNHGREVAAASAASRGVRPGTDGIVAFRYHRTLRGWMTARVVVPADAGRKPLQRTYRIRL
jgi:hypothetical protein